MLGAVRSAVLVPLALAVAAVTPRAVRAQQQVPPAVVGAAPPSVDDRARFEILSVGDSTFTFAIGSRGWVSVHARGDAVDPKRHNALVARFEVMSVAGGTATALITGATTQVTVNDVALLTAPREAFYRRRTFWGGVLAGAVAGAAITAAVK